MQRVARQQCKQAVVDRQLDLTGLGVRRSRFVGTCALVVGNVRRGEGAACARVLLSMPDELLGGSTQRASVERLVDRRTGIGDRAPFVVRQPVHARDEGGNGRREQFLGGGASFTHVVGGAL